MARLLLLGTAAGPLFITVWLIQALTRDGFDPTRHPMSLLSLGAGSWVQIANFVVVGLLLIGFALGVRRALHSGRADIWGPILFAANGIGLVLAGVFVTDAGAGFPAGAPVGAPESISWHGVLHEIGFAMGLCRRATFHRLDPPPFPLPAWGPISDPRATKVRPVALRDVDAFCIKGWNRRPTFATIARSGTQGQPELDTNVDTSATKDR